ncbi:Holin-like protein CidA [Duganella sp. Leaf126]|uniref:CidA/LrgA family protein n=1 Tax=Duganella sp. Leaf126 TaxID=1736266 RepID=UPI0006FD3827|nr:CidA/LrgA family protein [Duganella sp. Leaf126]KQQ31861.1 Holin-like protein CidA [Duganella sp. Leaf126]
MNTATFARLGHTLLQITLLIVIWYACDRLAAWLHLPFSGGVVGLLVMVTLLLTGVVRPSVVHQGAEWLLSNMLLFFIPLIVSVVQFTALIERQGLRLFAAIGIGFLCVLLATAYTVEWVCGFERRLRLRKLRAARQARHGRQNDRAARELPA